MLSRFSRPAPTIWEFALESTGAEEVARRRDGVAIDVTLR
jgi:hypothetical protein